jgi:hypothetical protein
MKVKCWSFFWHLLSRYSYKICSYMYTHTHPTHALYAYKQFYNYTQNRRPHPCRDHRNHIRLRRWRTRHNPIVAPRVRLQIIWETLFPVRNTSVEPGLRTPVGSVPTGHRYQPSCEVLELWRKNRDRYERIEMEATRQVAREDQWRRQSEEVHMEAMQALVADLPTVSSEWYNLGI